MNYGIKHVPLDKARRYFRSASQNEKLRLSLCASLAYSYLCNMKMGQWFVFGLLRILSRLPLRVHYFLADVVFVVVYYVVRYRRRLVRRQLADCFPEKSVGERREIERRFYHTLCDYVAEIVKELTMSPEEMHRRVRFVGLDELQDEMERRGVQMAYAYLGHYGNWEWLASFSLWMHDGMQAAQIYHPLRNVKADDLFLKMRARFGGVNIPMKETLRRIIPLRREGHGLMIGFIADQCPKWEAMHHWTRFLNHDTSFFVGTERLAARLGGVVFYVHVTRPRRGYYDCQIVPMSWDAAAEPEFALTDRYAQMLEEQIRQRPELWLWTHDRWKRTKEEWERRRRKESEE